MSIYRFETVTDGNSNFRVDNITIELDPEQTCHIMVEKVGFISYYGDNGSLLQA